MPTIQNILETLTNFAPVDAKMDFDNVGLLVGDSRAGVTKILVALDITSEVIDEAAELGAELIVSHHPILFSAKSVTDGTIVGKKIMRLLNRRISAICMHTNLDAADGGVNDALAAAIGLQNVTPIEPLPAYGRVGNLEKPLQMRDFLEKLKSSLRGNGLRFHNSGRPVSRVAVVGGSGGDYLQRAFDAGCDTLVTADVKYDVFLDARELGINVVDADHFRTENTVIPVLRSLLRAAYPTVLCEVSAKHGQTARFFV
ncbi:MAG: Nif3-like dinuclear metal center hexameric protein [Oscillospiraceae bacterium]|jgi:dinuclear metal center YbgI/SA1388 family protein|nr:Nif3-like dinuclear metal center hexameric protein [Oscillospiraceae bacterium]